MENTISSADVEKIYKIKCNKYPADKLTDDLKNILYVEAAREVATMNYINEISKSRKR